MQTIPFTSRSNFRVEERDASRQVLSQGKIDVLRFRMITDSNHDALSPV